MKKIPTQEKKIAKPKAQPSNDNDLQKYIALIRSDDKAQCLEGVIKVRQSVSADEPEPIIQQIINEAIVPTFLSFIKTDSEPELQYELIWMISNMCAGSYDQIKYLFQTGAIDLLFELLSCNNDRVIAQTVWAIANVTGDCSEYRDTCLEKGLIAKLLSAIEKFGGNAELLNNVVWVVRNLTANEPSPSLDQISASVPILCRIISNESNATEDTLASALWGLADIANINAQAIFDANCVPHIIRHMKSLNLTVLGGSLRTLGYLIGGTTEHARAVISYPEFLPQLFELTSHEKRPVRKDVFWIIGSITADSYETAECILNNPAYMTTLKNALNDGKQKVVNQASMAICNMFLETPAEPVAKLINEYNMLPCLSKILDNPDNKIQNKALFSIKSLFEVAENEAVQTSYRNKIKAEKLPKKLSAMSYTFESDSESADLINTIMLFIESAENVEFYKLHMKKIKEEGGGQDLYAEEMDEEDGGEGGEEDEWEDEEDEMDEEQK